MIDYIKQYNEEKEQNIRKLNDDPKTANVVRGFIEHVNQYLYGCYYTWMGRPIIQLPQDILSVQEVIMRVKPDLIIETGIAHGGSAVFYASMLELLGDSEKIKREVVAVDIELREHNRAALEEHAMRKRITVFDGSSTDPGIVADIRKIASRHDAVMVVLDSCHTHQHVYEELKAFAPLVSVGSYIVVFDTSIEFFGDNRGRPWGKGNNPFTAVKQFLSENDNFVCDKQFDEKSVLSSNIGGWLLKVK